LVVLDVKPVGIETDLEQVKQAILDTVQSDGLEWGETKFE
jgi:translation elongation factor EF-1beta